MNVVCAVASLNLRDGGPARSVSSLAAALAGAGASPKLVFGADPSLPEVPMPRGVPLLRVEASHSSLTRRLLSGHFFQTVKNAIGVPSDSIVHVHGVWLQECHDALMAARDAGCTTVLSARGMLEPWALNHKRLKKWLAWHLYQKKDLVRVNAFHATSFQEMNSIRKLGFNQPVIVLPNGVDLPVEATCDERSSCPRILLFLSRINPKKGLDILIAAWSRLRPKGWKLIIAGNDDANYCPHLMKMIRDGNVTDSVEYVGAVFGEAKSRLFRKASMFILPSYSENFGIVVAEAMAFGLPVIATHGAPWEELPLRGCGWHVPANTESLQDVLSSALSLNSEQLAEMGSRGRAFCQAAFSWRKIGEEMVSAYRYLLGQDSKPECVYAL